MNATGKKPFYLGIDLGGTNVKSGVVDDDGHALSMVSLPTEAIKGPDHGLMVLAEAGRKAVTESRLSWNEILGIGLGTPGTMDIPGGLLLEPPNLPGWNQFPVRDRLAAELKKPTVLQNDANAAAYGEYWVGAGRDAKSMALFTLGTGIGCGIIIDGKIIEGRHSHGAECGHVIIQMEGGREHPPGYFGRLEAYASATAVVKRALEELARSDEPSSLRKILAMNDLTSKSINEAAVAGDPMARRLMRQTARYLAVGAVNVMHTVDPDMVLFAGGMSAAGPDFLEAIRADVLAMALPTPAKLTVIDYATLGNDAGMIGAAGCARIAFGGKST